MARTARELGATTRLCAFSGGEPGGCCGRCSRPWPATAGSWRPRPPSGCSVVDRRGGTRELLASAWSGAPTRHELDDLFSATCAAALSSQALAVCNPWPGDLLPLEVYGNLVSDARANGVPVLVDLSSPRLDSALEGSPDVVKINDWELAEYVSGPVDGPRLRSAAELLLERGAGAAVITRGGEPAPRGDGRPGVGDRAAAPRARLPRGLRRLDARRHGRRPRGRRGPRAHALGGRRGRRGLLPAPRARQCPRPR